MQYNYGRWGSAEEYETKFNETMKKNLELLKSGKLPKNYMGGGPMPQYLYTLPTDNRGLPVSWRGKYIDNIGFPLYAEDWVKPLAKWIGDRPCLEIMAGTGFFSYALSLYGCKVIATDDFSWKPKFQNIFYQIENLDCIEAIKKYGKNVKFILCSWPYMDDNAYNCLMLMREINPKCRMIYIGEDWGGCTASDKFFDAIQVLDLKGFNEAVMDYRRWQGIHDFISLIK